MNQTKSKYHHGDLRQSLIEAASRMINEEGIEGLSLRKLADRVGVSRTAPYHHFADKNALLCAIAAEGFRRWHNEAQRILSQTDLPPHTRYRQFAQGYIHYATRYPELYDLMFGRTIWKQASATEDLKAVAYPSFQHQVDITRQWQAEGLLPNSLDSLRLAQVTWGTLHGLARLVIDGIYADSSHIDEMVDTLVDLVCPPVKSLR
ncbi:TetR/AcrR family transcriptional regulator [Aestuariibacter halophilus]|uniref:TetR/AcrR family transcriptional regulator n=1 Tax=Fluctibacter halophilus TaxID=226011 RepID=A0ABS8G6R8_9ALTE|nr:TetR/AcrR family transcriptional regulator [Aestuariibacter halophilus]MCC2616213.1 TetR/AcrR family transcriptional regulator [Aestuariibacter halophilus]